MLKSNSFEGKFREWSARYRKKEGEHCRLARGLSTIWTPLAERRRSFVRAFPSFLQWLPSSTWTGAIIAVPPKYKWKRYASRKSKTELVNVRFRLFISFRQRFHLSSIFFPFLVFIFFSFFIFIWSQCFETIDAMAELTHWILALFCVLCEYTKLSFFLSFVLLLLLLLWIIAKNSLEVGLHSVLLDNISLDVSF